MRLLPMLGLLGTLSLGGAGCKTVYDPIVVDGEVRAGLVVAPAAASVDGATQAEPAPGEPGRFVVYRPRTTVDWDKVGDVTGDVLEATGTALLYAAVITGRVLIECAAACGRCR